MTYSNHFLNDRKTRNSLIKYIGYGKPIFSTVIDKGHKNGPERHIITDTGIVFIINKNTEKLVTTLIARPGQIKKYYESQQQQAPENLLKIAYDHQKLGYNEI